MTQLIEQITSYWDNQPCNVLHSTADPETTKYWDEITERRYFVEPHIHDLADFSRWQGRRVLEIGCGIGTDAEQFVRHGADYTGVDLSKHSIALCQQRFRVQNLTAKFICADAADLLSLQDLGQFDLIYSMGVLHHYPNPQSIVRNAWQLLRPAGEFRFLVYAQNSWKAAMIEAGLDQFEAQAGCPYAETYDEDKLHWLVLGLFDIIDITQDHCFMYNVEHYRQGQYVLEPWFAAMSDSMRAAVKKQLGWHLCVKAVRRDSEP